MTTLVTLSTASPYVGPRAFAEEDRKIFFGRDTESRQLAALVIAHRAVLFYAQSGAGKTSLLKAGLTPELKRRKRVSILPVARVSGEARDDVANIFVYNALLNIYGKNARPDELAPLTLCQGLAPLLKQGGNGHRPQPQLLILDQFEEFFTTLTERNVDRGDFFKQLGDCLSAYPALSLLLSMREDYIARLDTFAGQLPDRLRTRFRMGRLGPEAALSAVVGPLKETERAYAPGVAEALVDNLRRVQHRVVTEKGSDTTYMMGSYVEPVHLQIVCRQLWDNLPPGRELIELEDVQQFGDVDQALTEFYEQALHAALPAAGMGERRLRRWFDTQLITPAQTRGLLFRGDYQTEGLPNPALDTLVDKYIVRADIRGGDTWYELSHDRLVEPILAANRAWWQAHANPLAAAVELWLRGGEGSAQLAEGTQLAELEAYARAHADDITADERRFLDESRHEEDRRQRKTAQRNLRLTIVASFAIFLCLAGLCTIAVLGAILAINARSNIAQLKTQIQASQLAEASRAELSADPELALMLATAGLGLSDQANTEASFYASVFSPFRTALRGHTDRVWWLAFSPDGERIVTASDDGTARLWNPAGEELAVLEGHAEFVASVAFSPDGERILTAGCDETGETGACTRGTARLWDQDGEELAVLEGHTDAILSGSFSPDGEPILTASSDGTARLWNLAGEELAVLAGHTEGVVSASFSPDGEQVVTASDDGTARLWTLSGDELTVFDGHADSVWSAIFSPDGKQILTAGEDGTARLWDLGGKELVTLDGHAESVWSAAFDPEGGRVLTASFDDTARLWDLSGEELAVLEGHTDNVWLAAFSPDGARILTASDDDTARLWDLSGEELAVLEGHTDTVRSAVFSPDGQRVLTASFDGTARLWELPLLVGHTDWVWSAVFSPDGKRVLTASRDGTARLWDRHGGGTAFLEGHTASVYWAAFSPDGEHVTTASGDGTARLWDLSGKQLAVLDEHADSVYSVAFSPDGERMVTASNDGTARLWDSSGEELAVLEGHKDTVWIATFSPDGERIATASSDGTARLWDLSGEELVVLEGHTDWVWWLAFSPNGERILTASRDRTARLWNLVGEQLAEMKGHADTVNSAAFSPDGERVLTASRDGTARLWDLAGRELTVLQGHTDTIWWAAFSPNGEQIVTAGNDSTARLWNLDGRLLGVLEGHSDSVNFAVFSPDGEQILTASDDGTARLWPSYRSQESRIAVARESLSRGFNQEECLRFFPDDPDACPQTVEALFALLEDAES